MSNDLHHIPSFDAASTLACAALDSAPACSAGTSFSRTYAGETKLEDWNAGRLHGP